MLWGILQWSWRAFLGLGLFPIFWVGFGASQSVFLVFKTGSWFLIALQCQEYTEELYKKDLHDQDNHDGVITHLEPDILECEVKWALGQITMNEASEGAGIPVQLFQILKDDAVKVLH